MSHEHDPQLKQLEAAFYGDGEVTADAIGARPSPQRQRLALGEVHMRHAAEMRTDVDSRLGKILAALGPEVGFTVQVIENTKSSGIHEDLDHPTLDYKITKPSDDGRSETYEYFKIGDILPGGGIEPDEGVLPEEVELAQRQLAELRGLKESGVLPDLELHTGRIFDSSAAIQRAPGVTVDYSGINNKQ